MDDLDFTVTQRPARGAGYQPALARRFFEATGTREEIAAGGALFVENQPGDRMYYIEEGQLNLVRGQRTIDIAVAGEIIGEMGLVARQPRRASAVARTPCRVIALDEPRFRAGIRQAPEFVLMLMYTMINRLRLTVARLSIANALPQAEAGGGWRLFDAALVEELTEHLQARPPVHAPVNKVIMREGEPGVFMYVVLSGSVAISVRGKVIERVGPGGVFGEMALVDQSPRAASATSEADTELLAINRNDFIGLVKSNPLFGISLLRGLALRMNRLLG